MPAVNYEKPSIAAEDHPYQVVVSASRPASPSDGDAIYETDTDKAYVWNGSSWVLTADASFLPDAASDDQTAAEVVFTPAGTIAATDVQAAISEVQTEAAADRVTDAATAAAATVAAAAVAAADTDAEALLASAATADATSFIHTQGSAVLYVRADDYDSEQDYYPNSVVGSDVMGALPGVESRPVFGLVDVLGEEYVHIDQRNATQSIEVPGPTTTTNSIWTVEGKVNPSDDNEMLLWRINDAQYAYVNTAGNLKYNDGVTGFTSASTLNTLIGVVHGVDPWEFRYMLSGTTMNVDVRVPGGTWTAAFSGTTVASKNIGKVNVGHSSTSALGFYGRYYWLRTRDGATGTSPISSFFDPAGFVAGNRAATGSWVDPIGNTWGTIFSDITGDTTRPERLSTVDSIYRPDVTANHVRHPKPGASDLADGFIVRAKVTPDQWDSDSYQTLVSYWQDVTDGRIFIWDITDAGQLRFVISSSGAGATTSYTSSTALTTVTGIADGETMWLEADYVTDTGAGSFGLTFRYSLDDAATWTDIVTATGASVVPFASPAVTLFEFGSYNAGGSNRMVGLHHEAQIMNQSNHMLGRFSAADADPDASTWVDKVTGQTVTITRSTSGDKMALVGSATWLFGGAERLVVPHSALLDLDVSEGLTVVLRVRSHSGGGDWGRIVAKNNTVTDDGWYLGKSASGPRIYAHMNDSVATVDVGEGVDNATYGDVATVVAVWDASGSEIYIDGVSDDSDSTVLADFSEVQDLAIGAAIDGGNPAVVEVMAVAVFNSGLNSDEVLKVHNELAGVVDDGSLAAEDVSFVPAGSIAAVSVQAAIEELDSENDHFQTCTAATRPGSPSEGDMIYETDTNRLQIYSGSAWRPVSDTETYAAGSRGYTDANWGFIFRPSVAGATGAFSFEDYGGTSVLMGTEAGKVGIGTTDPLDLLDVRGDAHFGDVATGSSAGFRIAVITPGSTQPGIMQKTTDAGAGTITYQQYFRGTTTAGSIATSTTTTTYNTSSDYRLKTDLGANKRSALERLGLLRPTTFTFLSDPDDGVHEGFIAHEVAAVVPNAVSGEKDAVDEDGEMIVQQLDAAKLVPLLVSAVQELTERVAALGG